MDIPSYVMEFAKQFYFNLSYKKRPKVISFAGKSETEKSTFVSYLSHILGSEGVPHSRLPFSFLLKEFCRNYLGVCKHPEFTQNPELQQHYKLILQKIRNEVSPDFHRNKWIEKAKPLTEQGFLILVEDVCFENEIETIRSLNGIVVYLTGKELTQDNNTQKHKSEFFTPDTCNATFEIDTTR